MKKLDHIEVIKDIPGYKMILKAVLKTQIQQLVEQLAETTGEESVLLTASVSDRSLSHLGSESGKYFLEHNVDIKSQFLGFCLKRHHDQKQNTIEHHGQSGLDPNTPQVNAAEPRQRGQQVCQLSKGSKIDNRSKPYTISKPRKSNQQGKSFLAGLKHHLTTSTAISQPDSKSVNDKPMIIKIENFEDEEGKGIDDRNNNSTSTTSYNSVIGVSNSVLNSCPILKPKSSQKLPGSLQMLCQHLPMTHFLMHQ